jgi:IS605 OrfB family transposase
MTELTKSIKVPIRLLEADPEIKNQKYRELNKIMNDQKYITNRAIEFWIAEKTSPGAINNYVTANNINVMQATNPSSKLYHILHHIAVEKNYEFLSSSYATIANNLSQSQVRENIKPFRSGKKSYPTRKQPLLILKNTSNIVKDEDAEQYTIKPSGYTKRGLIFITNLSWKDEGARVILDRMINEEYKFCDSVIIREKNGILKAAIAYKFESSPVLLNKDNVCGIDLGYNVPIACATNFNHAISKFGQEVNVWAVRRKFRAMRWRKQKTKGSASKSIKYEVSPDEKNYFDNFYHTLTKRVMDFCLQQGCGTIHLEDLSSLRNKELEEDGRTGEYKRLIWVPSKIKSMIEYKAKEHNIDVKFVSPKYTSRMCFRCKNVDAASRNGKKYKCVKCDYENHADINAAKNIASKPPLRSRDLTEES